MGIVEAPRGSGLTGVDSSLDLGGALRVERVLHSELRLPYRGFYGAPSVYSGDVAG